MAKGRGSLSFLERNQRVVGVIALVLIVGGTAFALLLQGGVFASTYTVTAVFEDAAGIRAGDFVTVAGLQAGTVEDVRIDKGHVSMDLAVRQEVELPASARAEVVVETLLGRQSVALIPDEAGEGEGALADGAIIPLERTATPVTITDLNDISVDLLEASDAEAFERFLEEVTEITRGKARDVQALIEGLDDVTAAVDARREQLGGLIESLRVLSTTLGQRDQTLVSLIDNFDVVLGNLAERQSDLETLLVATDAASHETADLIRRNREVLDSTLRSLHTDLLVIDEHQLDLAAAIAYLNQAVQGYSSVGYSQGRPNEWANIYIQSLGPLGIDAIVGQCGLVDQLFDTYFGTECGESQANGPGGGSAGPGSNRRTEPAPALVPPVPPAPPEPGLPCTIEDVVTSIVDGISPAAGGGCRGR